MTGLELTAKIYAKKIENGTKIKAIKENGDIVNLIFESDMLKWETGVFHTGYLFDKNIKFEIVEEEKGWFEPKIGENYWTIDSCGEFDWKTWINDEIDNYRYNNHNCFRSEEEAWEYKEYKEALRKAEKPFVFGEANYSIIYNFINKDLRLFQSYDTKRQGTTFLGQDREVAQAFIDDRKDCILKYEFDVWE